MTRMLYVWWDGRLAGCLKQDRQGRLGFAYADTWLQAEDAPALSVSLPKRAKPYPQRDCRPFFRGLLPEESQRDAAAQVLGVSRENDFSLLEHLGGDVAGALQFLPPEATPQPPAASQAAPLGDEELMRMIDALPTRPLLAGQAGLRLSLAGAQPKVPVVLADGKIALPAPEQPTTHILKPAIERFPGTVENEALAMRLADAVGLDAAQAELRTVRKRTFLLVKRYDRLEDDDGLRRLHQEDFCQALGLPPERKYASEGGPSFKACFTLLRQASVQPAIDVLKLLDAAIYNLILGNADAHGKNFSLLYGEAGPLLAPLYDLLSTAMYPELSPNLAMKLGKRATLADMDAKGWAAFARDSGLGLPLVRRRAAEISTLAKEHAPAVADELSRQGGHAGTLEKIADLVADRAERCLRTTR